MLNMSFLLKILYIIKHIQNVCTLVVAQHVKFKSTCVSVKNVSNRVKKKQFLIIFFGVIFSSASLK